MKKERDWQDELSAQARRPGELGPLTHGTVQDCGHGAGGPVYQWTRTEEDKTVSVVFLQAQYETKRAASVNWKAAKAILRKMAKVSLRHIFGTIPCVHRPNSLSKKMLNHIQPTFEADFHKRPFVLQNFSNHWKMREESFQSLKKWDEFSNHWKKLSNHWKTAVPPTSYRIVPNPGGALRIVDCRVTRLCEGGLR